MADATSPPGQTSAQGQEESQAREMVGQAQEKAQEAAGQAKGMMREQVDQRSTQAGESVSGAAEDLRSVGEELRKQGKETPAKYVDKGAEQAERLGSYLSESDGDKLLSDIEDFGRRQPLAVLAGGLVVGMAAARFLKASSSNRYRSRIGSESQTRELGSGAPRQRPIPQTPAEPAGVPVGTPEAPVSGQPAMGR
jgi:hypothetical protein